MLKQAFGQDKELLEEVVSLFNIFNDKFDDFGKSFDDKDVISRCQSGNATSL